MSRFLAAVLAMTIVLILGPTSVLGAGIRDFRDGWLLNPEDVAVILGTHSGMREGIPEGQADPGWGLWSGAGHGLLYAMEELPLKFLEAGLVRRGGRLPISLAVAWERLGDRLLMEETGVLRLRLGSNPRIGMRVRSRRWAVAGESLASGLDGDLEGHVDFPMGAGFAGSLELRLRPGGLPRGGMVGQRRTIAFFKVFLAGCGAAFLVDQRTDGAPVISLEVMGRLSSRLGVGLRFDPETGSVGGTMAARLGGVWLQSSHLTHPALGSTHRFHLGIGDPGASAR